MSILQDHDWKAKYSPADGSLLRVFFIPALRCAVRYDRTTGYFNAEALARAVTGVEDLVRNGGRMRLIVGCTLDEGEVAAIQRGESLRGTVEASLLRVPFRADDPVIRDALELLAWMVAQGHLQVKVAVPCDRQTGAPCAGVAIFHEKAGIIEDKTGDRIVFSGSINETVNGWTQNWDSFHVFTSWKSDVEHLNAEEESFQRLWIDREPSAKVMELGQAVRADLMRFLPEDNAPPRLLREPEASPPPPVTSEPVTEPVEPLPAPDDLHARTWDFIRNAANTHPGGEYLGEATAAITPWPHQLRAFERMYRHWPPRLLIADEVGLGKTIEAGLLLRQAWLSGRARRILILAPRAVLRQWQIELREKFNLNVPMYENGQLVWYPSPALAGEERRDVADDAWYRQPVLLASSQLMRRRDRARQLVEDADPWDLIVLDEAHHARRSPARDPLKGSPNQLLRLMRDLQGKTQGLILLTATPMQVHPIEVWDLLALLGLPQEWQAGAFLQFFALSVHPAPDDTSLASMAAMFRAMEARYQPFPEEDAVKLEPRHNSFTARKVLRALRDGAQTPLKMLKTDERRYALKLMRAYSPTRMLISRHTRELLREYHRAGKLTSNIASRQVDDVLVELAPQERALYGEVEDYISATYNQAAQEERTAIGFVMTIYKRRLASSFYALEQTLEKRLHGLARHDQNALTLNEEDLPDDELSEDSLDMDKAQRLEREGLRREEAETIQRLLEAKRALPESDSKAEALLRVLGDLQRERYEQIIVFTQYTDTLDFLREIICREMGFDAVLCFSGRGGEQWEQGAWQRISREKTRELFREGKARILLCTDAAAEGLNLQTCGALVNYDMPWNPMKVEQRIGRIDRLGQRFEMVRIINLMYKDTVETDVYMALRTRIGLFGTFVGRLQPILSSLPKTLAELTLHGGDTEAKSTAAVEKIAASLVQQQQSGFDLDEIQPEYLEMPERPRPPYDLPYLGQVLGNPGLLPPGYEATPLAGGRDYRYFIPGRREAIRVTTDPEYYEQHAESVELWSPGSPAFPWDLRERQ